MNTRKDNGEGCISQRADGIWTARIQIGTKADGKPKIKAFYGKTESEVKRKLKKFKKSIVNLPKDEISKLSLETYILKWLNIYKKNQLKPSSYDRLENTINKFIIPNIGFLKLSAIKQDDIQELFNLMYSDRLSYSSIKKVKDALNSCFKHAMVKDDIIKNPIMGTYIPATNQFDKKEIVCFSKEEIIKIKSELYRKYKTGKPVYSLPDAYILILNTGLRIGEVLGLKWTDVDFNRKLLHIQRNVVMVKNREEGSGYILKVQDTTKTFSGQRIINLNKSAIQCLKNLQAINGKYEYILTNSKGNIIPPHNFDKTFKRVIKSVNLKQCGVHSLRHTFASMLFQNGVDVKVVSKLLGHSDVSVTYNTYIHLIKEQKVNAVELINI